MKGVVFTEFLELVEEKFGFDTMTDIIADAALANDGAYTAVGTYHHAEMVALVSALSARTGVSVPDLLQVFGKHLFARFNAMYPMLFEDKGNAFDFLAGVQDHIHVEVRKLYPDAEFPQIETHQVSAQVMQLEYSSSRPFADFAEGLILGCVEFFEQRMQVETVDREKADNRRTFRITQIAD